jgi:hypothetical protein
MVTVTPPGYPNSQQIFLISFSIIFLGTGLMALPYRACQSGLGDSADPLASLNPDRISFRQRHFA